MTTDLDQQSFDYVVVGSGFGGSVAAFRLAQKGYQVAVFEMGKRFNAEDFPNTNWEIRRFLWLPHLGCYGIQKMDLLKNIMILSGTGVGGGSLVYGNTLFTPLADFFEQPVIQDIGGRKSLLPYFEMARNMLGVVDNPVLFEPDELLKQTAAEYNREFTFQPSPVGIFFGEENTTVSDPYFLGEGPDRTGCNFCGGCFIGCRYNAKNSLDKNYLYFAQKFGATIIPETEVVDVKPLSADGSEGYTIETRKVPGFWRSKPQEYRTKGVVFSGGVLGSLKLLLKLKQNKHLSRLSDRLGHDVRTNGETILGVKSRNKDVDYSRGIAASSSVFPDEHTHIQADRYPAGSDAMGLLGTMLTDGAGRLPRPIRLLGNILRSPLDFIRLSYPVGFAQRSMILVVMQNQDSGLQIIRKRSLMLPCRWKLSSISQENTALPTYIPLAHDFARRLAHRMNGLPGNTINEVLFNTPTTAHILGGCCMAENENQGVVDLHHRVFGYKNMLICDGSVIPANLGVNPALSITAFAERALSFIPVKEDQKGNLKLLAFEKQQDIGHLLTP
ncbi:GMC oxidoreductase [candidate division CSSED10-310 bacterium]|uniref:Cholesterol oxidase n=1 Tax=candidate division CSSED10-310 bacterium TaxID=2855610 RepID=A0ABV6YVI4_UNCC1